MVNYTNRGKITALAPTDGGTGLTDGTDHIHTGLIKALHGIAPGNYLMEFGNFQQVAGSSRTRFGFDGAATTIKLMRDGKYVKIITDINAEITAPHGTNDRYDLVVINSSDAIAIRAGTDHVTSPRVGGLSLGDIPVAMVKVEGGSGVNITTREVQMYSFDKAENSLSIAYNGGGTTYTETMSIYGDADRTIFLNKVANADFRFILADNTTDEKFEIMTDDDADGLFTPISSVFSVDGLGATTISGSITVGGNIIKASDGGSTITMDTSDNVTIAGDLTVGGGDITYGNGQDATLGVTATAHNTAGKPLSLSAGTTTAGTTDNIAGGSLTFKGGQGKGSGVGGDIIFQTAGRGISGSALNAHATALTISDNLTATFAGDITVTGNDITFGNGATVVNTSSSLLTITEATVTASAALTAGTSVSAPAVTAATSLSSDTQTILSPLGTPVISSATPGTLLTMNNYQYLEVLPAVANFYQLFDAGSLPTGTTITLKNLSAVDALVIPTGANVIDAGQVPAAVPVGITIGANQITLPGLRTVTLMSYAETAVALADPTLAFGFVGAPIWLGSTGWLIVGMF